MPNEPPMPASPQDSDAQPPLNEGFTEGGDLTLRSFDGVNFKVHSLLLSLASPVLAGMITADGTRQTLVGVLERADLVALMLKFIYPLLPPTASSFEQLSDAFRVAEKYKLGAMKLLLRKQMIAPNEPVSISANPLRAWVVAAAHGLSEETEVAMSLAWKRYNFPQACIPDITKDISGYVLFIKLLVVPFARSLILRDVLFSFHKEPMQLNSSNCKWTLCNFCAGMYHNSKRRSAPEWQALWADAVFMQLQGLPVHEWGPIFKIGFFKAVLRHNGEEPIRFPGSHGICKCPDSINQSPTEFELWTASVHEHLKARVTPALLGDLTVSNSLIGHSAFKTLFDSVHQSASFEPWQL